MDPSDPSRDAYVAILDDMIDRLRSRIATGDDSELPGLGALLLKYLEKRESFLGIGPALKVRDGSIAAVTRKLELVGQKEK